MDLKRNYTYEDYKRSQGSGYSTAGSEQSAKFAESMASQGIGNPNATTTNFSSTGSKAAGTAAKGAKGAGAAGAAVSEAPAIYSTFAQVSKKDGRLSEEGNVTHEVAWGKNIGSMAASGAAIGSAFGPWGTVIGAGVGAIGGVAASLIDKSNQPTDQEIINKRNQYQHNIMMQGIMDNSTQPQQMQAAETGFKKVEGNKPMELERDEIVLRRTGKSFKKVADFKGGKLHKHGGEKYSASDGDIIIPRNKANKVERDMRLRNWSSVESTIQTLPVDNGQTVKAEDGVKEVNATNPKSSQNSGWTAEMVQAYIDRKTLKGKKASIDGATLLELANKNDFPIELALIQGAKESNFGSNGAGEWTNNVFNWGNLTEGDKKTREQALKDGDRKVFKDTTSGVDTYMKGVKKNYLANVDSWRDLLKDESFVNTGSKRYADTKDYEAELRAELDTLTSTVEPLRIENTAPDINASLKPGPVEDPNSFKARYKRGIDLDKVDISEGGFTNLSTEAGKRAYDIKQREVGDTEKNTRAGLDVAGNVPGLGVGAGFLSDAMGSVGDFFSGQEDRSKQGRYEYYTAEADRLDRTGNSKEAEEFRAKAKKFKDYENLDEIMLGRNSDEELKNGEDVTKIIQFIQDKGGTWYGEKFQELNQGLNLMSSIVTGEDKEAAQMRSMVAYAGAFKDDEWEALMNQAIDEGIVDNEYVYKFVQQAHYNPEFYDTQDSKNMMTFDVATILANPKALASIATGLGSKVKGVGKVSAKLYKAVKAKGWGKVLREAAAKAGKPVADMYDQVARSLSTSPRFSGVEDYSKMVDDIQAAAKADGVELSAEAVKKIDDTRSSIKKATDWVKKLPENMKSAYNKMDLDGVDKARKDIMKHTGKSMDELKAMSDEDIATMFAKKSDELIGEITNASKGRSDAWKAYNKSNEALEAAKANLNKIKGPGNASDETIKILEAERKAALNTAKKADEKVAMHLNESERLELFMDADEYKDKWRVVSQLNDGANNQFKLAQKSVANSEDATKLADDIAKNISSAKRSQAVKINNAESTIDALAKNADAAKVDAAADATKKVADYDAFVKRFPKLANKIENADEYAKMFRSKLVTEEAIIRALYNKFPDDPEVKKAAELGPEVVVGSDKPDSDEVFPEGTTPEGEGEGEGKGGDGEVDPGPERTPEGDLKPETLFPEDNKFMPTDTAESAVPGAATGNTAWLGSITDGLESLAQYAPALYNISKGLQPPEKASRRYVSPQTLKYNNMSQAQLNAIDDAFTASIGNARNMSGGMMSNFRSNTSQAWADRISQRGKVNQFEAGRADQIAQQNVSILNNADQYNTQVDERADIMDARNRAATEQFMGQGISDIANVSAMRRRDKNAKEANNKELDIMRASFGLPAETVPTAGGLGRAGRQERRQEKREINNQEAPYESVPTLDLRLQDQDREGDARLFGGRLS